MGYRDRRTIPCREKRTGALSHFHGTAGQLLEAAFPPVDGRQGGEPAEIAQRIRTLSTAGYDEILAALQVLSTVQNAAVVVHGAAGCAMGALPFFGGSSAVFSTNLDERDTILGGDEKLRQTILSAAAGGPEAIFILGTPVTAINNDDVASVLMELEEEVSARLVYIKTDGFQTKTAVSGLDLVSHALLRHIVLEPDKSRSEAPFVNLVSLSERRADIAAAAAFFEALDIPLNLLPRFSSVSAIRRAGGAAATVALNPDEGELLAAGLEEAFGVPWLRLPSPIGSAAIAQWSAALGEALDRRADADRWLCRQQEALAGEIGRKPLAGRRVFLNLELSAAAAAFDLVGELGGAVCGMMIPYVDESNRSRLRFLEGHEELTVIVGIGQGFELANVFQRLGPHLYLGGAADSAVAASLGVPPVLGAFRQTLYGAAGIRGLAAAGAVSIPGIFQLAAPRYRPAWLRKSAGWHVKREVK